MTDNSDNDGAIEHLVNKILDPDELKDWASLRNSIFLAECWDHVNPPIGDKLRKLLEARSTICMSKNIERR